MTTATTTGTPTANGTHCQSGWNSPEIIIVPHPMKPPTRARFFLRSPYGPGRSPLAATAMAPHTPTVSDTH